MRIIHTTDPVPRDTLGQLAYYNALDVCSLPEIIPQLLESMRPEHKFIYSFEMDLQSALLEMEFNGCPVDIRERDRLIFEYEREQKQLEANLHLLCEAVGYYDYYLRIYRELFSMQSGIDSAALPLSWQDWLAISIQDRRSIKKGNEEALETYHKGLKKFGPPYLPGDKAEWKRHKNGAFNASSPQDKLRLFYHFFGSPTNSVAQEFPCRPPWNQTRGINEIKGRKQNNEYGPTTDRDALEKLQTRALDSDSRDAVYWAQPFISCCLAIADYSKALGFLRCELEDGYFKCSFGAVTDTGRLNSKENAQGYGSNGQNITPRLRIILTSPAGWKSSTPDYEQIESRMVAARCFIQFGATNYIAATESGDLHSLACSMVWEGLPWPEEFTLDHLLKYGPFPKELIKAAKRIAKEEFYRGKSRRDVSKTLGHGSNYLGKPEHMSKQSHIPLDLVRHYQDVYFSAFPEIKQWHNWIIEQVQVHGEYATIFGRVRRFWGRSSDDATIRKAVAHDGQSPAADYTNSALLKLHKAILRGEVPAKLFLQKHDEIGFRYKEQDEAIAISRAKAIMEQHCILTSPRGQTRDWYVPAEVQCGWNLGHRQDYDENGKLEKPINPDGLIEWTGKDERVRSPNLLQQLMGL